MTPLSRRSFVGATAAAGAAAATVGLPGATGTAAAAAPVTGTAGATATATGTPADVKHVVILMQENRSFDHYFGAMKGCAASTTSRGCSSRAATPSSASPTRAAPTAT